MLFTPFTRTWWKSLVKGEGSADTEGDVGEEELDLESSHLVEDDEPRSHSRSHRSSHNDDHDGDSDHDHDHDEDGNHFTHEGMAQGDASGDLSNDDPLAPAFDLDRGAPISPTSHHPLPALEPHVNVKSAKEFFNSEILYRFDILEDNDRNELQSRYRIELKGYQRGI